MIDAFVAIVTQTWRIVSRTPALWIIGAVGALCGGLGSVSAGPEPLEMKSALIRVSFHPSRWRIRFVDGSSQ
ncbi:MAG: hypothetical protein ACE5FI_03080 [Anaerolineales bacterium]